MSLNVSRESEMRLCTASQQVEDRILTILASFKITYGVYVQLAHLAKQAK